MEVVFKITGIAGTGAMGRGIAQIAAQAGSQVLLFDTQPQAGERAAAAITSQWERLAEKGRMAPEQVTALKQRITIAPSLQALSVCDLVVEAIVERLDVKQKLFTELESVVRDDAVPQVAEMPPVWVSPKAARRAELLQLLKNLGAAIETGASPSAQALTVVAPLGFDVTTMAVVERHDPARTIGIDMLVSDETTRRRVLATNPVTRTDMRDAAHALFARDGKAVSVIRDSGGFVTQRVIATIVNIASDMCQQRICSPQDLETAVTLGLGYPRGPLAMGNLYGPTNLLEVLFNMQTVYGDPRYRPSPWLRRRGALGLSLLQEEN